jgi:uncharacterized protein (DUF58 family)
VGLAAPFVLWLAVGLATVREPEVEVSTGADRDRAVEGEEVEVAVRLATPATVARLELWLRAHPNLDPVDGTGTRVLRLEAGEEATVRFRLRCGRWGAYRLGEVQVRCHDRSGLVAFDQRLAAALPLKVYPSPQVLRALLRPLHQQRLVGDQLTRLADDGVEFADIRPLLPGDPIRHVNWRLSARRGELHVNRHHPERNTDVVLFLDTFAETGDERGSTLDLVVRAAASLAGQYLGSKDRVGLVGFGGYLTWLYPAAGRAQHGLPAAGQPPEPMAGGCRSNRADPRPPRSLADRTRLGDHPQQRFWWSAGKRSQVRWISEGAPGGRGTARARRCRRGHR